jgi:hypothetical protein
VAPRRRGSLGLLLLAAACADPSTPGHPDASTPDAAPWACDPAADQDVDCLVNAVEGCTEAPPRDSDSDGSPDFMDADADNDGVFDYLEAGADCAAPRDTDGDGLPDYRDRDADGDGVRDGDEDRNGDGRLGDCETPCADAGVCAPDQHCAAPPGVCVSLPCLGGETSPHNVDTDGDGIADGLDGTFICNPRSEDNPLGLRPIKIVDSKLTGYPIADWRVAVEVDAVETEPDIQDATTAHAARTFDSPTADVAVAGFLIARPSEALDAVAEASAGIDALGYLASLGPIDVTVRAAGAHGTSLDGHDTVRATIARLITPFPTDVTAVRAELLPRLLLASPSAVAVPDPGWSGVVDSDFMVVFQTLLRPERGQVLFMGAVARTADFDDRTRPTGLRVDDLANGTGLAESMNEERAECEAMLAADAPVADIVWIVDESGSMVDDRARVASYAADLFARALAAGLDFRMGVTDMNDARVGQFAERQPGGTGDRWLLPTEPDLFAAAINEPSGPDFKDDAEEHGLSQGRAALVRHLPRDDADPQRFRQEAEIAVIYVTDEKAQEIKDGVPGLPTGNIELSTSQLDLVRAFTAGYALDLFDQNALAHLIALPLPFDDPVCSGAGEISYGYFDLVTATGGQVGSLCQDDLGATLDAILDSIVGNASPIGLRYVPISATLAVTRDGVLVDRSRDHGWDYYAPANSIVFYGMPIDPLAPAEIVISYRRWQEQVPIL